MTPSKILDAIFYDLGYFSFLEKSENGFLLELNQQRLMALKHLAASTSTIEEFLDRDRCHRWGDLCRLPKPGRPGDPVHHPFGQGIGV